MEASSASPPGQASIESVPEDLLVRIFGAVSKRTGGYSHALVRRDWAALAPAAQASCVIRIRMPETASPSESAPLPLEDTPREESSPSASSSSELEEDEEEEADEEQDWERRMRATLEEGERRREEALQRPRIIPSPEDGSPLPAHVATELLQFSGLTSLALTISTPLPSSFLDALSPRLQQLRIEPGPGWDSSWNDTMPVLPQALLRFQSLRTLVLLCHSLPGTSYELPPTLKYLSLGGMGALEKMDNCWERCAAGAVLDALNLPRVLRLKELRILRVNLASLTHDGPALRCLPDALTELTNLEELNVRACELDGEVLPAQFGRLRKLKRLLLETWGRIVIPWSFTDLSALSFIYFSAEFGIEAPPGMDALTSLRRMEMNDRWHTNSYDAANLFNVPSLTALQTTGLPPDPSALTSLRELRVNTFSMEPEHRAPQWGNLNHFGDVGVLTQLRTLHIEAAGCLQEENRLPDSISQLVCLEELILCSNHWLRQLPDALGNLCSLRRLVVEDLPKLEQLPECLGELATLQELRMSKCPRVRTLPLSLAHLPSLQAVRLEDMRRLIIPPELLQAWQGSLTHLEIRGCRDPKNMRVLKPAGPSSQAAT